MKPKLKSNMKPQAEINMVLAAGAPETETKHGHKGFGCVSDESGLCVGATSKPLDGIVDLVRTRFPKYVSIPDSEFNIIKKDGALWKKQYYNEYCYVRFNNDCFEMTLFKCDWKPFDKIEDAYSNDSTSFAIKDLNEVKVIINCLV